MQKVCYLLLGSNKGAREQYISDSLTLIEKNIGKINTLSSIFESEAWGYADKDNYLNRAAEIFVNLPVEKLLEKCQNIELMLGRIRNNVRYEARTIDVDIIFYDSEIIKTETLQIPHPRMHLRRFVLEPLNEICPDFIHPVFNKTISELLLTCTDKGWVKRK